MAGSFLTHFLAWWNSPLFGDDYEYDPPIVRRPSITGAGPTGNWYIVHQHSPTGSTTDLAGHRTRRGAERQVVLCKKHLPWAGKGEWIVKPVSEWESK